MADEPTHHLERRSTDHRLGRLETTTSELKSDFSGLRSDMNNVCRSMDQISDQLSNFANMFNRSQRTNWPPILSAGAICLTIFGLLFMFYTRDQTRFDRTVDLVTTHVSDGHPRWVSEKVDAVDAKVADVSRRELALSKEFHAHLAEDLEFEGRTLERLRALERETFGGK